MRNINKMGTIITQQSPWSSVKKWSGEYLEESTWGEYQGEGELSGMSIQGVSIQGGVYSGGGYSPQNMNLVAATKTCTVSNWNAFLFWASSLLHTFYFHFSAINFFLYSIAGRKFRTDCAALFCGRKRKTLKSDTFKSKDSVTVDDTIMVD